MHTTLDVEPVRSRETRLIGAYVDPRLKRELELAAQRNDRTVSAEIRLAVRRHLDTSRSALVP